MHLRRRTGIPGGKRRTARLRPCRPTARSAWCRSWSRSRWRGGLLVVELEQGHDGARCTRGVDVDQACVRHQPRERELRDKLGFEVSGEVPEHHAARRRAAAHAVPRHRPRESRQLHRADQRAGAESADPARLRQVRRIRIDGWHRPVRPGDRQGLCVPRVGEDGRRSTRCRRARRGRPTRKTSRTRRPSRRRAGIRPSVRSTRRSSRPRPTCTRRATIRGCTSTRSSTRRRVQKRSSASTSSRPTCRRRRRRRTCCTSLPTCATTVMTPRPRMEGPGA